MNNPAYIGASDISTELGVSLRSAYYIIAKLNKQLLLQNPSTIIFKGYVLRDYYEESVFQKRRN